MKTREIMKAVLFGAGIILLSAACNKKDEEITLDFNITVPSDWSYYIYANTGFVYHALSPMKNDHDTISEDLIVMKIAAENMTLEQFYTSYAAAISKDTSYHKISVVDTTINGEDAIKLTHFQLVVSINQAQKDTAILDAKMQKYLMMNRNYGYVVSFNALTNTFKEYQPLFDNIIATFSFKE
jgi:hypothetical protein